VSARWRRRPQRPFYKGVIDGLVFMVFLAMVVVSLQRAGFLVPETGRYAAIDGDSLRKDGSELRLHGIDAPELHQNCSNRMGGDYPCGREAQRALAKLIGQSELKCFIHETDRYGRGVATCNAGDVEVNGEMVRLGWAIAYRHHTSRYTAEEAEARKGERGIWQGNFEDPAQWRENHRGSLTGAGLGD
jgi:endonuclease YncB( thermonuclease family)